ncbi:hypothetical protein [Methanococcus maripaludis]|uniref:Uncharacterized protein n=1 Tax=Methanococcus maripaludis TaxID=39152 RepID=A0A7J9NZX0_METMI|nr:hypothetical protein [Methanococcus maripaludis]MBA2853242.1 hypothetical protein [Methanococcus maripaludis]MBA2860340.1 hypothetical protein [Methanococcus maripaludis]
MLQKNYKYLFNNLFFVFSIFLLISSVYSYSDYYKVNVDEKSKTETFNIDKVENYTYKLSYVHYGNLQEGMYVKIFVNGHNIHEYSKDLSNTGSGAYKKSENETDITNYLVNGSNEFKIESNIWETENSSPYYALENFEITGHEVSTIKLPISSDVNFLVFILCLICLMRRKG